MPARTSVDFFDVQVWRPLTFEELPPRGFHDLAWTVAKLKPGVTLEQARSQMDAIGDRLAREYPESNKNYGVVVEPFPRPVGIDVEASLYLLFAAIPRELSNASRCLSPVMFTCESATKAHSRMRHPSVGRHDIED